MPINAGAIGIQPVQPQRPTGETEGIQRRGDGSAAGFRPQTTVSLQTAIEDLAGTLSKIASQEKFGMEKLPSDIGQVVRNILQQSFSIEATLSQGIGSTIESQRFSNDQIMILARMLAQIGALADKGFSMELSDETKTLLSQFKNLIVSESGGNVLEPVLMSKSAFELIDHKNPEQLPQALYEILAQLSQMTTTTTFNQPQQSEGMQFLNQLIKFFMPRPNSESSTAQTQNQQQTQQQAQQRPRPTPTQRLLNSMYRQLDDPYANLQKQQAAQNRSDPSQQFFQKSQNQPQTQQSTQNPQNQPQTQQSTQNPQNQSQTQQSTQNPQNQPQTQQSTQNPQNQSQTQQSTQNPQNQPQPQQSTQNPQNQPQTQQSTQNPQNQSQTQQASQNFLREESPVPNENFLSKQQELKNQMQEAKNLLLKQPMQNTPQSMDTMKNLAQFLMKNSQTMTPRDAALLQNFVNNSQQMLPETEARHLQNLLRLCQQNVPAVVQQAAVQHKLPDLPRLWAFMQLCDMANLTSKMTPRAFKRAGRDVSDFANIMRNFTSSDNSTVQNQRSFQMMLPLYLGENETSYPTYLSVYDEDVEDPDTGVNKKETWLRICVLTDNIGAAELIFRVYEGNQLDMRFYFSEIEVAEDFRSYVSDLRGSIRETSFNIGEIRIGSIGERMLAS